MLVPAVSQGWPASSAAFDRQSGTGCALGTEESSGRAGETSCPQEAAGAPKRTVRKAAQAAQAGRADAGAGGSFPAAGNARGSQESNGPSGPMISTG